MPILKNESNLNVNFLLPWLLLLLLSKMIEVLDDFYLAQKHLNDPGLKMAIDKFISVLKTEGLEEIKADRSRI